MKFVWDARVQSIRTEFLSSTADVEFLGTGRDGLLSLRLVLPLDVDATQMGEEWTLTLERKQ